MVTPKVPPHLRKKRGRPALNLETIKVKLTPTEAANLRVAALTSGLTQSEIVRRAIDREIERMEKRKNPREKGESA